ncbi:MAG: phage integrase N-terminal SAM-like domain-containing protein [Flavobacteriaceae bacterium]|nr:phage integrase N-terminal SAM-like domain-containing protein [Flavobacteriaceae bacterium]
MIVANKSDQTIRNYVRGLVKLYEFHDKDPKELELDQVIDFLVFLKDDRGLNWRTIKIYVAGLRYYYQEILENVSLAVLVAFVLELIPFLTV